MRVRTSTVLVLAALSALASALTAACDDGVAGLPSSDNAPSIPRESGPRFSAASQSAESMPVRSKVVSNGPADTIRLGEYRGGGGGGGGGAERVRPPGFPRGSRQEAEEMHAAAREAVAQQRRRGSPACELAYEAARDLQRERQTKTPGRRAPSIDRESFIETCELRPEIEQWCLIPSYVRDNSAECDERAHTRYARAIDRYERRAEGEADDWAPTEPITDPAAAAIPPPSMGPVRVTAD